jgi:glycosyltransferase involved in cell wall biosynthesis
MQTTRIVHLLFNRVQQLPVLGYELDFFRDAGYELHLVCPSYAVDAGDFRVRFPHVRLHALRLRTREWSDAQHPVLKLLRFAEFTLKARRRIARLAPAVFVGHDMPAMLPLFHLFRRPEPVVYNAHEIWSEASEDNAPLRGAWRKLERRAVSRSDAVVVPEPNRAQILQQEYGSRSAPVLAANIPPLREPFRESAYLRERFGLKPSDVIVLYQGLLAASRCLLELIAAMTELPPSYHLVLIGGGSASYLERIRELISREGLSPRVHVLPWVDPRELPLITASADIGALPYRNSGRNNYYAAPNKLYEYLFAGLRVVSSDFPGLRSVIDGGGYGACAAPDDSRDLARAISEAAGLEGGRPLAERARAEFRWEEQAEALRTLYIALTEKRA